MGGAVNSDGARILILAPDQDEAAGLEEFAPVTFIETGTLKAELIIDSLKIPALPAYIYQLGESMIVAANSPQQLISRIQSLVAVCAPPVPTRTQEPVRAETVERVRTREDVAQRIKERAQVRAQEHQRRRENNSRAYKRTLEEAHNDDV